MKGKKIIGGVALGLLGLGVVGGSLYGSVEAIKDYKQTEMFKQNGLVKNNKLSALARAVQKQEYNFSGAKLMMLSASGETIPKFSLIVCQNMTSQSAIGSYLNSFGVDVTAFITPTLNINVINAVNSGCKIYFTTQEFTTGMGGWSGMDGFYWTATPYHSVSDITGDSEAPSIDKEAVFIVNVDNPLSKEEILSHISAYDEVDGYVEVEFTSCDYDPDNLVLGEHKAVVSATDLSGNTATEEIIINVVDIEAPTISIGSLGNLYSMRYDDTFNADEFLSRNVIVQDNFDRTEDIDVNIISNDYVGNEGRVGTYNVEVEAIDSSGNRATATSYFVVYDDIAPEITGPDSLEATTEHLMTETEILANFSAVDRYDGDIELTLEDYDEYASQWSAKIPSTSMTVKVVAVDSNGNRTEKAVHMIVKDTTPPVFYGGMEGEVEVSYDEPMTLQSILATIQFNDNWSEYENIAVQISTENYTENENRVGTYEIKIIARDEAGNVSEEHVIQMKVVDKKAPIITGTQTIEIGQNKELTLEELKSKILVNDGHDGVITDYEISGFDNYQANKNKVGNYEVTIKATDKSGNSATFTITIKVLDTEAPIIVFDDYFILVDEGEELTKEQIIEMASKVLGIEASEIVSVDGEFDTNEVGKYKVNLKTIDNQVYTFTISVNANYENTTQYRALEWHEWLWKWFSILFNYEVGYTTESFWDFGTRCGYIAEVYSTGQIKVVGDSDTTEDGGSTNEDTENKVIIEALSYHLCSIEQSDLQSIYYEKGHIYLIPKGTYEDDGDQAILITDKVSFSDNYLNELVANEFDVVLVLENSAPSDMMFTKYGVSFVVIETDNTYTEDGFKMEVNNESI